MFGRETTLIQKAKEADRVLSALGIERLSESGKQIRAALGMELLGQKYKLIGMHGKASFVKDNSDVLEQVKTMLIEEGVLSRPIKKLEKK